MKKELKDSIKHYNEARKVWEKADETMTELFRKEIIPLLKKGKVREARYAISDMPECLGKFDLISVISDHDISRATQKLMKVRKNWKKKDFKEAYADQWDSIPRSLKDCFRQMEEFVFHTYDLEYIWECIRDEST